MMLTTVQTLILCLLRKKLSSDCISIMISNHKENDKENYYKIFKCKNYNDNKAIYDYNILLLYLTSNTIIDKEFKLLKEIKDNDHKNVSVYALEGCPACEELKKKLNNIGITYEEITMNGNDEMWTQLEEWGGSDFAPQVKVDDYLIKEVEYETVNELISKTVSLMIDRKVVLK